MLKVIKNIIKMLERNKYILKRLGFIKATLIHLGIGVFSISVMQLLFSSLRVNPLFSIPFGVAMGEILYFKHFYEFLGEKKSKRKDYEI